MPVPLLDDPAVVAYAIQSRLHHELARLALLVHRSTDDKMRLAIGGAVALGDAGYRRFTHDLDVFARPVSARRLVRALAAEGLRTFWITDAHAVAYLPEDNAHVAAGEPPEVRVDVLSTLSEPEASAIRTAVPSARLGAPLRVFRPDYLAAIKFLAGRPQDLVDFDALVLRGVDVARVRYLVALADDALVPALVARVAAAQKPLLRDAQRNWLSGKEFEAAFYAAYGAAQAKGPAKARRKRSATAAKGGAAGA